MVGAFALVGVARFGGVAAPPPPAEPADPPALAALALPPDADFALIDEVLQKRAPNLGLTLRRQLGVAIADEARQAGYDPLLILAIIDVESDFLEDAVSNKGARGLMQIKPSTLYFLAQREGLKLSREEVASDPALCVRLGIRYLRWLNDRFKDLDLTLMAYNAGPARIRQAMRDRNLEPFRRYPHLVRRDYWRFRRGQGLEGDWAFALRDEPRLLGR
ncbi:MAG: lytic transglycosylase domain-containing protein [Myxococcaceae bacterium]|nr:lytic transglycosylase domain-containing protein [Myxococcaceae bacterium]